MRTLEMPRMGERVVNLFVFLVLIPILYFRAEGGVGNWKYTHYLFNYEDEFMKRGFVGEVLRILFDSTTYEVVTSVAYTFLIILVALLFFAYVRSYMLKGEKGALIFAIVAVTSPATIQHFIYDVGRLDIYMVLLTVLCLFAVQATYGFATFIIVSLLLAISILVHEASLFICLPPVLAYWYFRDSSQKAVVLQALSFAALFVTTYLVSTKGLVTLYGMEEHLQMLREQYGDRVVPSSLNVVHYGGVRENIERTLGVALSIPYAYNHAVMLVVLSPLLFLIVQFVRELLDSREFKAVLLVLAAFSPLALYPLGHDHYRWWSIALTNFFLVLSFAAVDRECVSSAVFGVLERYRYVALLIAVVGLVVGPLGVMNSFDLAGQAWRALGL